MRKVYVRLFRTSDGGDQTACNPEPRDQALTSKKARHKNKQNEVKRVRIHNLSEEYGGRKRIAWHDFPVSSALVSFLGLSFQCGGPHGQPKNTPASTPVAD